jgi:hypothetical protein
MRRLLRTGKLVAICAAGIALSVALFGPPTIARVYFGANDFVGFYTAGAIVFSKDLYDIGGFMQAQGRATGWTSDQLLYARLPWEAVLFAPLTSMGFATARVVWTAICLLALVAFGACWPNVPVRSRLISICWTVPVFMSIVAGQDVPLILAALGLGFLCIERKRPITAGLCISFCMAKPHLFWPLAAVFVFHRMWRVCAGGAIGATVLGAVSFLVGGMAWPGHFLNLIRFVDKNARIDLMPTLHSALLGIRYGGAMEAGIVLLLISLTALAVTWRQSAALALLTGILAGRHAFLSDCAFMLPALFLCWPFPGQRKAMLVLISPITFVPAVLGYPAWPALVMTAGALFLAWDSAPRIRGLCRASMSKPSLQFQPPVTRF